MDNYNECVCCLCNKVRLLSLQIANCASSITIGTVTTLPAGSKATVTNVGTPSNVVLNFGIPQGEDGANPVSVTDKGINPVTGGHKYTLDFSDGNSYAFEAPKGDKGTDGIDSDITTMHVWMETPLATVNIAPSEDIFGVTTPKGIGFYSIQGTNIPNFTIAGSAIKVNSPGTYLVTYQFVVKDTKCKVCIRRKDVCVKGGDIVLSNPDGNILVSGSMIYTISPKDITDTNGVFSIFNEDTKPMPIDPKSFCWTATQLSTTYDAAFIKSPFN